MTESNLNSPLVTISPDIVVAEVSPSASKLHLPRTPS